MNHVYMQLKLILCVSNLQSKYAEFGAKGIPGSITMLMLPTSGSSKHVDRRWPTCFVRSRDVEVQQRASRQLSEAWKCLEKLHTAIAAFLKPARFAIHQSDDHGKEKIENTDHIVKGTEQQAKDLSLAHHEEENAQDGAWRRMCTKIQHTESMLGIGIELGRTRQIQISWYSTSGFQPVMIPRIFQVTTAQVSAKWRVQRMCFCWLAFLQNLGTWASTASLILVASRKSLVPNQKASPTFKRSSADTLNAMCFVKGKGSPCDFVNFVCRVDFKHGPQLFWSGSPGPGQELPTSYCFY